MQWRRHIGLGALLLAVAAAIVYGFWPRPALVDLTPVARGPLTVTVEQEGKTRVVDRYVVSAPVAGYARRIDLKVGDRVQRGQPLARLEPLRAEALDPRRRAEAQARVAAAQAALRRAEQEVQAARAQAELATTQVARLKPLYAQGHVAHESLDQAEARARGTAAARRAAEFAVQVARYDLEAARTALRYAGEGSHGPTEPVTVRAPVDGEVLKIDHKAEGAIAAGQPLLDVGDTRSLEVEVDVLSPDAVRIQPGMRVLFDRWGGEGSLAGVVRTVEPAGFTKVSALGVEEQRVLVIADITSPRDKWARLGDGYRVEARFILWHADSVLQVPASALFRYRDGWAVFAVRNGRARRQAVSVGQRTGLSAQVLSGLSEGETVIVHPDESIRDGAAVRAR